MYDTDQVSSKRPSKRASTSSTYVPPDVQQFKLVQPPAGGLQRKGTGRVDFGLRGDKKKEAAAKPPPPPPKAAPLPVIHQAPAPSSASMLR